MKHEHPVKILRYCALNLWLLLFPLLRSITLIPFSPDAIGNWLRGAWMDIIVMLFIFGLALLRWLMCRFYLNKECFMLVHGIIMQKHIVIPFDKITAVSESDIRLPFILKLSFFKIDTAAGKASGSTVLWLRAKDCSEFSELIPICKKDRPYLFSYSINPWTVLLYSFLFSSSISGTLYIAAFFIEAGNAAGEILTELHIAKALSEMSNAAASVFRAVPEIIILILIILLFCRILSFIVNLLSCSGFHTRVNKKHIMISSGFFPKKKVHIYLPSIECVILKQRLLSRLSQKASLFITYPSCSKDRQTLLVPIVSERQMHSSVLFKGHKSKSFSSQKALWCFLWQPFTIISIILGLLLIISYTKPYACEILFPLSGIALVPAAALLLVRLISFRIQFASQDDKSITLCYSKGLSFFTLNADKENIAVIKITRTPAAIKHHYFNAIVHLKGGQTAVLRGISK
jgi:membrane protein YdbS with pleckstrin-like domain